MSNAVIKRSLLERLQVIGLSPDLHNDEKAVALVCEETGCSREDAARELVSMRIEQGSRIMLNLGITEAPPAFLASVATSRYLLSQRDPVLRSRPFDDVFAEKVSLSAAELRKELGAPGDYASKARKAVERSEFEREVA